MKCRLIAAGTRLPDWVNTGFREYQKRLRAPLALELEEIPISPSRAGENPQPAMVREGERMLAALGPKDHVVALEISGSVSRFKSLCGLRAIARSIPVIVPSATASRIEAFARARGALRHDGTRPRRRVS